jgi:hypothetical protein
MNLSDKEQAFLVRGLDKATTPDEAETCAKNFFKLLRARGVESYALLAQLAAASKAPPPPTQQPTQKPASDSQKQTDNSYWRSGSRKNTQTQRPQYFDFSMPEWSPPPKQSLSTGKVLFLLTLSFAIAFSFSHEFFSALIFGLFFAIPLISFRWLRFLLLWSSLASIFLILFYAMCHH